MAGSTGQAAWLERRLRSVVAPVAAVTSLLALLLSGAAEAGDGEGGAGGSEVRATVAGLERGSIPHARALPGDLGGDSLSPLRRAPAPPRVRLDASADHPEMLLRVLMSRSPDDPRWYPSPFQVGPAAVVVSGQVEGSGWGPAPRAFYLRLVDARAARQPVGEAMPSDAVAVLHGRGAGKVTEVGRATYRVAPSTDGRFELVARFATVDGRAPVAGDGFFAEASFDGAFSCGDRCARSGVFRLWKRVFVERDAMYRAGASVAAWAGEGAVEIEVDDVGPFKGASRERPMDVVLMHARRSGGDGTEPNLVVAAVRRDRRSRAGVVELAYPTLRDLEMDDAIVVPDKGVFEPPSLETARRVFAKAFVEIVDAGNPRTVVPYRRFRVEEFGTDFSDFAQRWSDYGDTSTASASNVVMLVAADHKTQTMPYGGEEMHSAIGSCNLRPVRLNNVFLWVGAVERQVRMSPRGTGIGGRRPADVLDELVTHEMAHLFGVDDCDGCDRRQNDEGTGLSTMSSPVGPEMGDGVAGFHAEEYRQIRASIDPLPQG